MSDYVYAMGRSSNVLPGAQAAPSPLAAFVPIFFIFAIFYFLLIRPQQKQQKKHQEMLTQLKKNDEVVTHGGIHGTIVNLDGETITLRVDDNTRIKFQRSAVAHVKKKAS